LKIQFEIQHVTFIISEVGGGTILLHNVASGKMVKLKKK
jgi:hypothetical protein